MPYIINKTDGSIVATITDGTVDNSSTSLTLIGKNYKGIGEFYNENLVFLLENFSNPTPPLKQIKGQLWFNSNANKLNVYDGTNWRPVGSPFVSNNRPNDLVAGDLWIDKNTQQLKFYDGINLIVAGPSYTVLQGKTGWVAEEIIDRNANSKVIASMYIANTRVAIYNQTSLEPLLGIPGFVEEGGILQPGLSFSTLIENNNLNASVEIAKSILDETDGILDSTKFVRSDKSGSIDGSLTISSANGIIVGPNANFSVFIESITDQPNKTFISNRDSNSKTLFEIKTDNEFQIPIELDPVTKKVSIYPQDNWQVNGNVPTLDINADTTIRGNLTVIGETEFTNSTVLKISDKNIELAVTATPTNQTADGAGITVIGPIGNNKTITWQLNGIFVDVNTTLSNWEISDNLKISPAKAFYVGNNNVLSTTTLGSTVISSSLTSVGNLVDLTAADFEFLENKLTVLNSKDLIISVDQTKFITLENKVRITNVETPFGQFDVANKDYVDSVKSNNNFMTIDITGLSNPNIDSVAQINALYPSISARLDDIIKVLCLSYSYAGVGAPTVNRIVKTFKCESLVGVRTWVYQTGQDIVIS
jgi:hypothetical protein